MLYVWRSNALKQYGQGWLIANAKSETKAKEFIRREFDTWLKINREYFLIDGLPSDEDSANDIETIRLSLEKDLETKPDTRSAILINGSE